jgi:hypothetical protein
MHSTHHSSSVGQSLGSSAGLARVDSVGVGSSDSLGSSVAALGNSLAEGLGQGLGAAGARGLGLGDGSGQGVASGRRVCKGKTGVAAQQEGQTGGSRGGQTVHAWQLEVAVNVYGAGCSVATTTRNCWPRSAGIGVVTQDSEVMLDWQEPV